MIVALTGLDASVDERRQALEEALRRDPEHVPSHTKTQGFATGIPWTHLGKDAALNYREALKAVS